jgi:hypothetical protein
VFVVERSRCREDSHNFFNGSIVDQYLLTAKMPRHTEIDAERKETIEYDPSAESIEVSVSTSGGVLGSRPPSPVPVSQDGQSSTGGSSAAEVVALLSQQLKRFSIMPPPSVVTPTSSSPSCPVDSSAATTLPPPIPAGPAGSTTAITANTFQLTPRRPPSLPKSSLPLDAAPAVASRSPSPASLPLTPQTLAAFQQQISRSPTRTVSNASSPGGNIPTASSSASVSSATTAPHANPRMVVGSPTTSHASYGSIPPTAALPPFATSRTLELTPIMRNTTVATTAAAAATTSAEEDWYDSSRYHEDFYFEQQEVAFDYVDDLSDDDEDEDEEGINPPVFRVTATPPTAGRNHSFLHGEHVFFSSSSEPEAPALPSLTADATAAMPSFLLPLVAPQFHSLQPHYYDNTHHNVLDYSFDPTEGTDTDESTNCSYLLLGGESKDNRQGLQEIFVAKPGLTSSSTTTAAAAASSESHGHHRLQHAQTLGSSAIPTLRPAHHVHGSTTSLDTATDDDDDDESTHRLVQLEQQWQQDYPPAVDIHDDDASLSSRGSSFYGEEIDNRPVSIPTAVVVSPQAACSTSSSSQANEAAISWTTPPPEQDQAQQRRKRKLWKRNERVYRWLKAIEAHSSHGAVVVKGSPLQTAAQRCPSPPAEVTRFHRLPHRRPLSTTSSDITGLCREPPDWRGPLSLDSGLAQHLRSYSSNDVTLYESHGVRRRRLTAHGNHASGGGVLQLSQLGTLRGKTDDSTEP